MISTITLANALILGLLASLSPCLFPVLPTFVAYLTNSDSNRRDGLIASLLVTLGIMTVFVILSLTFTTLFAILAPNYRIFRTIQGLILMLLGVLLVLGLSLNWTVLDRLNTFADSIIQKINNPWLTSYLIGLTFTLLAAPCAIIVFISAFTLALDQTLIGSIVIMTIFSIGAGLPFFLVGGIFPKAKDLLIRERKNIEHYVTVIAGLMIIAIGSYLTVDGLNIL